MKDDFLQERRGHFYRVFLYDRLPRGQTKLRTLFCRFHYFELYRVHILLKEQVKAYEIFESYEQFATFKVLSSLIVFVKLIKLSKMNYCGFRPVALKIL